WSVHLKTTFTTTKATKVEDAQLIKVIPVANSGSSGICKLERERDGRTSFLFQKRRFVYSVETGSFAPLKYVLDADKKPLLREFQLSKGLTSEAKVEQVHKHYGDNTFDIPVPTFIELWKE